MTISCAERAQGKKWLLVPPFSQIIFGFILVERGPLFIVWLFHTSLLNVSCWTKLFLRPFSPHDLTHSSFQLSITFHLFTVIICAAKQRPLVSLGCFPGSPGCAWWWPWRQGTGGWCGLWAGWCSWKAPSHQGGHRLFAGRHLCCQNESRMKSAGSWCLGDHWRQRCEERW